MIAAKRMFAGFLEGQSTDWGQLPPAPMPAFICGFSWIDMMDMQITVN